MNLKIKSQPEDFIVEEIAALPFVPKGSYAVYLLEKQGWNTTDVLKEIARTLKIANDDCAYAGRKDKHALSRQYITIQGGKPQGFAGKDYSISFVGFMERPMGPDLLSGNHFKIAVRNLSREEADSALNEIREVESFGFPNYFDDQRFGSFNAEQGFLGEKILQGHFNGAMKIYFTSPSSEDRKDEITRKRYLFDHWKDWKVCLSSARTGLEKEAFEHLEKHPSGFVAVLRQISREELSLFFSCYQSFLWNEILRRLTQERITAGLRRYPGKAGEYLFCQKYSGDGRDYFEKLIIPTPGAKAQMPDEATARIYQRLMEERGITRAMFNKLKTRQAFFKTIDRQAIIRPEKLVLGCEADELNKNKRVLRLDFILPRGSFATMLIKRLFSSS